MPQSDFVTTIFAWVSAHPDWMSAFIFVSALAESLTIVGVIIPGALVMFTLGALIGLGHVDFWSAYVWSTLGAIAGDAISFWIGRVFRDDIRKLWPFSKHPHIIARSEDFFRQHGGKGVLFGRFFGPVRGTIPTVAGMMNMGWREFTIANVISGVLWAPAYLIPGMVFGASLDIASRVAGRLAMLIAIIVAVLWLTTWLLRNIVTFCQMHAAEALQRFYVWSQARPYIGKVTASLLDPQRGEACGLTALAIVLLGSLLLADLCLRAAGQQLPSGLDQSLYGFFQELRNPWADQLLLFVAQWGDNAVTLPIGLTVFAWLLWKRHIPAAQHWLIVIGFGMATHLLFQWLLPVSTPAPMNALNTGTSFPSSHATFSMLVFGFLAMLISGQLPIGRRWMVYLATAFLIVPMAFAHLYLGAHWFTGTIAGLCLGLIWVAVLSVAYRRHGGTTPIPWRGLLVVSIGTFIVAQAANVALHFEKDLARYQPQIALQTYTQAQWLSGHWQQLPQQRIDLGGTQRQAFTIQWAGPQEALAQRLQQAGWEPAPPTDLKGIILWLSPQVGLHELPVLPQMHEGSEDDLRWVYYGQEQNARWVLRLWDVNTFLKEGNVPIWVGTLRQQQLQPRMKLFTIAAESQTEVPDTALVPAWQGLETRLVQQPATGQNITLIVGPYTESASHGQ